MSYRRIVVMGAALVLAASAPSAAQQRPGRPVVDDRAKDVRDLREDLRDRREDVVDRREDVRDRR